MFRQQRRFRQPSRERRVCEGEDSRNRQQQHAVEIAVQINGKTKTTIMIDKDEDKVSVIAKAKEAISAKLTGNIVKEIYVPGRIVNIVQK